MISVWVAIDSTNQPLRNSVGPAWSSDSNIQKVMKSKTELSGPKMYMKCRTNLMSQAAGRASVSGSTLSVGMASWPVSYRRLFSRIWDGSNGRNARNKEAPAALKMFPKFEEVAISTYFIVLAKMRLPSITPVASTIERLSRTRIHAELARAHLLYGE